MNLLSAKSFAKILDCSVSQIYKMRQARQIPEADVKLFGDSPRGYRWHVETVEAYVRSKNTSNPVAEDAPPFVKIDVEKILKRRKVA